jgi:RimJ/RimL family protein N-acetyltransferase
MTNKTAPMAKRVGARLHAILRFLAGDYQLWRIYSIAASQCREPDTRFDIRPIEDLSIFTRPDLEVPLRRANWYKPGAMGFAAWRDDNLDGVCWFWPGHLLTERNIGQQPDDCAELIQITVSTEQRGKGTGPALINFAGRRLHEAGYRRLYAQIWLTNRPSIRAFEKAGWKQVGWFIEFQPFFLSKKIAMRWAFRERLADSNTIVSNWGVHGKAT